MKMINENQRITLTLGQLRRLVSEAKKFNPDWDEDGNAAKQSQDLDAMAFYSIDYFIEQEKHDTGDMWHADEQWAKDFREWVAKNYPEYLEDEWWYGDWWELRNQFNDEMGIDMWGWDDEEEEDGVEVDGKLITSKEQAWYWLRDKLKEYGNTDDFPDEEDYVLRKLIEKFGNTYFWNK